MQKVKISSDVVYVGVDDNQTDLFENQYIIPNGISYNSYVIRDAHTAVMDTVDVRFGEEWLANVAEALGGSKPEYLVVQHVEPDHSGSVKMFLDKYPEAKIVGNAKTFMFLRQFFGQDFQNQVVVKEADTLDLGKHKLTFFMAAMVHWPEVMVTYDATDKILFSADGFGKFGSLSTDEEWDCEARRYYFNICGKYGSPVQALLKKAAKLDISVICPLHGPILSENLGHYIGLYQKWSAYEPETDGVFIAYASIHGNTAKAALAIEEKLTQRGIKVECFDLSRCDLAEAVENAFRYNRSILAASSYDGGVFTPMDDFLGHLRAKTFQKRSVALIENGTWAPSAARTMRAALEAMKDITILEPVVTITSAVDAASQAKLDELTDVVASLKM